ncbi:hypothetical protein G9A89_001862 [Geosiphon pyriformis]|nr:hypothetical protein G9A89_001862 [Geosiphon pyriformis]
MARTFFLIPILVMILIPNLIAVKNDTNKQSPIEAVVPLPELNLKDLFPGCSNDDNSVDCKELLRMLEKEEEQMSWEKLDNIN